MKRLLTTLYHNSLFKKIIPTLVYCLQKELDDCESVLDLGCGEDSPLQYCKGVKKSVGVEVFKPYLNKSKKKKIHAKYVCKKIEDVDFPENKFDAVIMIDVLEHLPKKTGRQIFSRAQKWARKKIIITTPNGYVEQGDFDRNPYQKHRSGWNYRELKSLGFKCFGLAGLGVLRTPRHTDTKEADLTTSIRFRPKFLWFVVASLSQIVTYRFPRLAFELFCVKNL